MGSMAPRLILAMLLVFSAGALLSAEPARDKPPEISKPVMEAVEALLKDPEWGVDKRKGDTGAEIQPLIALGAEAVESMVAAWGLLGDPEDSKDAKKCDDPVPPRAVVRRRWLLTTHEIIFDEQNKIPASVRAQVAALYVRAARTDPNPFVKACGLLMAAFMPTGNPEDLAVFIDLMAERQQTSSCSTLGELASVAVSEQVSKDAQPTLPEGASPQETQKAWKQWYQDNRERLEFDPKQQKFRLKPEPSKNAEPDSPKK